MAHEELEMETPRHCFFGSMKETFGEMAGGVEKCARRGGLQNPLGLPCFVFVP